MQRIDRVRVIAAPGGVKAKIVILRVCGEARLVAQHVPHREAGFPGFHRIQAGIGIACEMDFDSVLSKRCSQNIHDPGVHVQFFVRHQLLQCQVGGQHFGDGGQVVQGVGRHGGDAFIRPAVGKIGIQFSPGVFIHEPPVADDGQLRAGKAMLDVGRNQVIHQPHGLRTNPRGSEIPVQHSRVRDVNRHGVFQIRGPDFRNLQGIDAIRRRCGVIHPMRAGAKGRRVVSVRVDVQFEAFHCRSYVQPQRPLAVIA